MVTLYWYNDGADADWATLTGNWWYDALHTVQAAGLPLSSDDVVTVGDPGTGPEVDLDTWTEPASIDATATGITFTSAAAAQLGIAITGDCTFNGDAISGDITGDATFNDSSQLGGALTGDATFNDTSNINDAGGSMTGDAVFNDSSFSLSSITGSATFNDSSYNANAVTVNATFNDSSYNAESGNVTGNATFNHQSQNRASIGGTATFHGYGLNGSEILGMP